MSRREDRVPQGRLRRTAPLAGLTARTVCGRVIAGARQVAGDHGAVERFDRRAAERYAELFGRSRGVLMKLGQILSMGDTRGWGGGGFGPYLQALGRLHHAVPAMHPALVQEMLASGLGSGVGQFAEFDQEPLAAASIGQVHRAVLHDGRHVAIKIQYPGASQAIIDDLANAELLATFLRVTMAATAVRSDVRAVAHAGAERIREEIDYRNEAANVTRFGNFYQGHPFIRIPQVIHEASTDRVLTMTYLDGLDWTEAQQADGQLKNTWAEAIMRFMCTNRAILGVLHADPHPTNYRFFTDGTVGVVDFGCVQTLTEQERRCWMPLIRAAVDGRATDLRRLLGEAGLLDADPSLTAEELYRWWANMLHDIITESQPVTYTPQHRAQVVASMVDFRDHRHPLARISYPAAAIFIARCQLNLVSICAALGATLPTRAIADDVDGLAEPITPLGRQHHAWLRTRGLDSPLHPTLD